MLRKIITNLSSSQLLFVNKNWFGAHAPPPSKLPKATSQYIHFNVRNVFGNWEKVPARIGQSVLQALQYMKVQKFDIEICDGHDATYPPHLRPHDYFSDGPQCGLCRIQLHDNWHNRVMNETDGFVSGQETMLHHVPNPKSNTRLACCVPVQEWMDGMTFTILPNPQLGGKVELS